MHLFSLFTSLFSHLYTFLLDFENLVLRHGFQFQCGFHHPSIHPDTLRSVRHAHNSVASTKRHYSYQAQVSVRRTQFVVKSPSSSGGTSIEAWLHRGAAIIRPTASQRRPTMASRWLRLRAKKRLNSGFKAFDGQLLYLCTPHNLRFPFCTLAITKGLETLVSKSWPFLEPYLISRAARQVFDLWHFCRELGGALLMPFSTFGSFFLLVLPTSDGSGQQSYPITA